MRKRFPWQCLAVGLLALFASLSCRGDEGGATRLLIIDHNILHGILNEDLAAEPFDRFPERLPLIAKALAEAQPDIILLQEVLVSGGEGYPDVRAALRDTLGEEYRQLFGSITGEPINQGALGQMTLTRLPVVSSENRHIGGARAVHRVTVETHAGPLDIYNVHLDGTSFAEPQAAVDEIAKVLDFIEQTRSGGPVILAGDFNAEPSDPSIQRVLQAGFNDALAEAGDPTCNKAGDPGCTNSTIPLGDNPENRADTRIDYIFVLPGYEVTVEVADASPFLNEALDLGGGRLLWPSDHIGLRAVVELR